jgi:hypothetical protein
MSRSSVFRKIKGEPPAAKRRGEHWYNLAAAAKSSPGEWFKMPDVAQGVSHAIRTGRYAAFRDGGWEVRDQVRTSGDDSRKRVDLYVRYLGE